MSKLQKYPLTEFIRELIDITQDKIVQGEVDGTDLTLWEFQEIVEITLERFTSMLCIDCGEDTSDEYYMVEDAIWREATDSQERQGLLCIGCLESRLGYPLKSEDFPKDILLNQAILNQAILEQDKKGVGNISDRLKNRILD